MPDIEPPSADTPSEALSAENVAPRIGELFAGYGGLGMGVQAALGGEIAWFSEYDAGPSKILEHRFPGVPNHGDITTIDWSTVEPVDILTGGSPCQDLSHAGRRAGMTDGTRSNLWVAMREAIAQLRPSVVVWENVRGAFSAAADSAVEPCPGCVGDGSGVHLRALGRVLGDLSDLGYDTRWHGLRASDVGAPHGRFRVFVVATDAQGNAGRVSDRDGGAAADSERRGRDWRARDTLRGALERAAAPGRCEGSRLLPSPRTSDTNGAGQHGDGGVDLRTAVTLLPTPTTEPDTGNGHARNLGKEARLLPTPMVGSSSPASHGQISGQWREQMAEALARWGDYAPAVQHWEDILGRPAPDPTKVSTRGNAQLAPAFVEWMMGLPAGWITEVPGITRTEALKALGNGVVPQQAEAALREVFSWQVAA